MGRLTEFLFSHPTANDAQPIENDTSFAGLTSSTVESSLLQFMENFENDEITESPAVCRMHIPSWLNVWCIVITVCILAVLVVLGLIMRQVQIQKHRHARTGIIINIFLTNVYNK